MRIFKNLCGSRRIYFTAFLKNLPFNKLFLMVCISKEFVVRFQLKGGWVVKNRNETTYGAIAKTLLCITLCVLPFFAGCAVNNSNAQTVQHNKKELAAPTLRHGQSLYGLRPI